VYASNRSEIAGKSKAGVVIENSIICVTTLNLVLFRIKSVPILQRK
jgi:hypothetical protein